MAKIVIDPITRIEGHLRIEAEVGGGKVNDAWSSSTQFRGIEKILQSRDPRDAWYFVQRFCGVCTTVHSIASIRSVENALNIKVPENAELIRNLIIGIQNVQDHVIHFYHLHALDWVDITSGLKADPVKTAALAASISDWPLNSPTYFKGVQDKLKAFVAKGRLGPFANAYWGHPAYKLPPEANLMATAHYLEALEWQKDVIRIHAILGSKNPHPQTFLVGGMAIALDPNSQTALNDDKLEEIRHFAGQGQGLCRQGLHSRPAGRRIVLQGLGRNRRRRRQLHDLRRIPGGQQRQTGSALAAARRYHRQGPLQGLPGRPAKDSRIC